MKLAIMQPYLFPYIGYFSLIKNADFFIFFDSPQYIRKGWINRNRILGVNNEETYFTVPIKKVSQDVAIKDIKIANNEMWREKIRGQLSVYKKRAPYYKDVIYLIEDVVSTKAEGISELAISSIVKTCSYLGICFKYNIYSKMQMHSFKACAPDEWALNITKELGYSTYINPPGGKGFFNPKKYKDANIELQFLTQELQQYNQRINKFIPGLSIIDVMMFCTPEEIKNMMELFVLE